MAVKLEHVWKTYGEGATAVHALRNASLQVNDGEFVVILGPSGSGKTTLLNLVGSIDEPTAGSLVANGVDLDTLDAAERTKFRRHRVGFIFQFFNLIPTLTAAENVELVAALTGPDAASRAVAVLEQVGLGERLNHFPSELSGGEQQRVAIARALAKEAPVLLCDEPTGELDVETGRVILELLRSLDQEQGKTVLVVTHNAAIGDISDRVLRLHSGEIVEDLVIANPMPAAELDW